MHTCVFAREFMACGKLTVCLWLPWVTEGGDYQGDTTGF